MKDEYSGGQRSKFGKSLYMAGDKDWLLIYFREQEKDGNAENEYLRILINAKRE